MLDWIAGEARDSLRQVRAALAEYVQDTEDTTQLRFAATHLHQVEGALFMAELEAAAQLMSDASSLIHTQLEKPELPVETLHNALEQCMMALENWLEAATRGEEPLSEQPLIEASNAIRSLQGKQALETEVIFQPDLDAYRSQPRVEGGVTAEISELHRQYQHALLGWLKNHADQSSLAQLLDALDQLEAEARLPATGLLCASAGALAETASLDAASATPRVRRLLGEVEREIKQFADAGETALPREEQEPLIRAMLQELARAGRMGERGGRLLQTLGMSPAGEADNDSVAAHRAELEAMRFIAPQVETEIAGVRYFIDDYIDLSADERSSWEAVADRMQGLIDLAVGSGAESMGALLAAIRQSCGDYASGLVDMPAEDFAISVATGLMLAESGSREAAMDFVDWRLRVQQAIVGLGMSAPDVEPGALTSRKEFAETLQTLGKEIRSSLSQVEESVKLFDRQRQDTDLLRGAEKGLRDIFGALEILDRESVAELAGEACEAVAALRGKELAPSDHLLDSVAMAAGTIEACVMGFEEDRPEIEALARGALADLRAAVRWDEQGGETVSTDNIARIGRYLSAWMENPANENHREQLLDEIRSSRFDSHAEARERILSLIEEAPRDGGLPSDELARELHHAFEAISQDSTAQDMSQAPAQEAMQPEVRHVFVSEAARYLAQLRTLLNDPQGCGGVSDARHVLDALSGASAALGLRSMSEAGMALAGDLEIREGSGLELDAAWQDHLRSYADNADALLQALARGAVVDDFERVFREIADSAPQSAVEANPASETGDENDDSVRDHIDLSDVFKEEARQLLTEFEHQVDGWEQSLSRDAALHDLIRLMHTVKGGARITGRPDVAEMAQDVERALSRIRETPGESAGALPRLVHEVVPRLRLMVDAKMNSVTVDTPPQEPLAGASVESDAVSVEDAKNRAQSEAVPRPMPDPSPDFDSEVREIFLEEANDLLSGMSPLLQQLLSGGTQGEKALQEVRRVFHTIKGGARMSGLDSLGDLAHKVESLMQERLDRSELPDEAMISLLQEISDEMMVAVDAVGAGTEPSLERIRNRIQRLNSEPAVVADEAPSKPENRPPRASPESAEEADADTEDGEVDSGDLPEQPLEMSGRAGTIRVTTAILDDLVNYASEISISRSRMRQEFSSFAGLVTEMRGIVERFQRYFRDFEIEAESSVMANPVHRATPSAGSDGEFDPQHLDHYSKFDPLELDRYSQLQQLTRSLSECVDDMVNTEAGMERVAWEAETLFQHDARLHSGLHEQLMRTRMQPVSILSGRLRHLVRTISSELGKQVDLDLIGEAVELDRSIMERIAAPLEHMVRNAIDHGIETPEQRRKQGKDETGNIHVEFRQAYNEVIMRFSDDGAGVNLSRLREKAIAAGRADASTDDQTLIRLVLDAGISTAEKVTQVSGRGIGMDVVASEVRYLGGQVDLESVAGEGTTIVIRLPLSLSITRATIVRSGGMLFALPQSSIASMLTLPGSRLAELRSQPHPVIQYREEEYAWSMLCDRMEIASLGIDQDEYPALLIRSGRRHVAISVESVEGTEDLIVKPLNPQLSGVPRITGASVTSNGAIVLLLDPGALRKQLDSDPDQEVARNIMHQRVVSSPRKATPGRGNGKFIMVVDDSVTVRKVTGRLMERHGYQVALARDGLEALNQIKERRPDLMLLDIEMPEMDGYELLANLRGHRETADIPVIMVSSRSGEKHRARAVELGAKDYFSKPYEDALLIDRVAELLAETGD